MQNAKIPKTSEHWKSYLNFTGSYKKKSVLDQEKLEQYNKSNKTYLANPTEQVQHLQIFSKTKPSQ